jgi:NTE family protein
MKQKLAFVLGGGGSRGALQVGSLYALLENGFQPDLLVGTSIGAANAAFLALNGFSREGLDLLRGVWHHAAEMDLLPSNYIQITLRAMLGRSHINPSQRIQEFLIQNGITAELCFADIKGPRLLMVSSDLNTGKPVFHGESLEDKVLDALLLSTALPPWTMPIKKQSQYLMDGGVLSNLPIEAALEAGATHIVALDLLDPREFFEASNKFGYFVDRLTFAVEKRATDLELGLAKARGLPVFHVNLNSKDLIALWDFHHTEDLIAQGYEITQQAIAENPPDLLRPAWFSAQRLFSFFRGLK